MAMNTKIPSTTFAVIAIAAALIFLTLNNFVNLAIAVNDNDVGSLNPNFTTPSSNFNNSPNPVSNSNFTTPSSNFNNSPNPVSNTSPNPVSNIMTKGVGVQDQFNLDQFDQCVMQKDVGLSGKLGLSDVASCYSQIFANKYGP
jgi:hypothetical protein